MIVKDTDALARINSPLNLINRMKNITENKVKSDAMNLFGLRKTELQRPSAGPAIPAFNPFSVKKETFTTESITVTSNEHESEFRIETIDDISKDHDSKIALGLAHDSAIKLLNNSITALAAKLDDVKADKLPAVIAAASKTVESIRRERLESIKQNKDREVHYHFYTPQQKKLTDYEVVEVAQ